MGIEFLISWALGYALSKGADKMGDNLRQVLLDDPFAIELREEVEEWTDQLPDDLGTDLDARSVLGQMFHAKKESSEYGEAQQRLSATLRQPEVPPEDEWFEALLERWEEVRHELSAAEAHPFFTQEKELAEGQLHDLSERLHHICQQSDQHFRTTVKSAIDELEKKVDQLYDTPWVTHTDYFSSWMSDEGLFRHSWTLVGRDGVRNALRKFALEQEVQVAILPGRGGIGKSKLLQTFSEELLETEESAEVRLVSESTEVKKTYAGSLPEGKPLVIVLDDAHRRDRKELLALFQIVQQKNAEGIPTKLILSTRPYRADTIESAILRHGFDPAHIEKLDRLDSLSIDEMRELSRQALGPGYEGFADQLASIGEDSPLVVTVGGLLVRRERIDPRLLIEESEEFRSIVLEAFQDLFSRRISDRVLPSETEGVLRLVAALSPVRPADNQFIEEAASFLEMRAGRIRTVLHELEGAGAFVRRGGLIRITPDVLSDDILHKACRTPEGTTTSFVIRVLDHFSGRAAERILRNLAELDWRIRRAEGQSDLLDEIWGSIQETYREGDVHQKTQILSQLEEVAYYLPDRMLRMAEHTLSQPIETDEEDAIFARRLEDQLARVLQHIAYTVNLLPICLELLWILVDLDNQRGPAFSSDAFGVLKKLAKPHYRKPISVQSHILEAIEAWIEEEEVYGITAGPRFLDLLDQLLVKVADEWHAEDHSFRGGAYVVRMTEGHRKLRLRAIEAIVQYGRAEYAGIRDALEAKESLINVLQAPQPLFGLDIPEEAHDAFEEEQLRAVEALGQLRTHWKHPLFDVELLRSLRWHAQNAPTQRVREQVAHLAGDIDTGFETRITQSLMYGIDRRNPQEDEAPVGFEDHSEDPDAMRCRTAKEFIDEFPDPESGAYELNHRLRELKDTVPGDSTFADSKRANPRRFLQLLASEDSAYATGVAQYLLEHPGGPLDKYIGPFIQEAESDTEVDTQILIEGALNNGDGQSESIARIPQLWYSDAEERETDFGKRILQSDHETTRRRAIESLVHNLEAPPDEKISLALEANVDDDAELADKLFSLFNPFHGIGLDQVDDDDLRALLRKLKRVGRLDKHWIQEFLQVASQRVPKDVFSLLLNRLRRETKEGYPDYQAAPGALLEEHVGFGESLQGLAESQDYEDMLRQVRDLMLEENRPHSVPDVFVAVSNGINEEGREILREWLRNCNSDRLRAVLELIEEAPETFVLDNDGFVNTVLDVAHGMGDEHSDKAKRRLLWAARPGSRMRMPHQPAPEDARNRDRGHELAEKHDSNPLLGDFYAELATQAEERIEENLRRDEEVEI